MATLNESQGSKAAKGRTKKATPRVDLTAMVDLMFLLTTFFMLTTSLGSLNAADIAKPIKTDVTDNYPESRTMTILLGKNNQAVCYMGTIEKADMKVVAVKNIQDELKANELKVAKTHSNNPAKFMIVIIKPTKTSKFQDFVDLVDEMKIVGIKSYAIDDDHISKEESLFMKSKGM
ncbi:biopolymer transporter ExbD [Pedobacter sp. HDW13]|uniref:ExbD/TolR family protein n=1 Tax=unclassified Pedobacter TaxID=2628915 RepID=UPI000F5B273D|nr:MULTISPECIES: biopolymer transporter ExbD [unclassified Pedobacter]QIL39655.1 biopolymer transporter ExbD [Pedobacter sp. HDW13]RQO79869.1 biopolymer transporter ExbD [Pedobacter sp. KBW01]